MEYVRQLEKQFTSRHPSATIGVDQGTGKVSAGFDDRRANQNHIEE